MSVPLTMGLVITCVLIQMVAMFVLAMLDIN